ncbi:MAG: ABC transporter permease [Bacteroidetes bacterium]|nr:ABC transporter permease [Bacteroidota bacterium]
MKKILLFFKKKPIWAILLLLIIIISILAPEFLAMRNLLNILLQSSVNGIMAVGMTYLMINGFFDLSVGTVMGLSAALAVGLQPMGLFPAIMLALLAGAGIGAVNGFLVAKAKINAFVVTLGSFIGVRGLIYIYTKEDALIGEIMGFCDFGSSNVLGVPTLFLIMITIAIVAEFALRKTSHGRNTYAVGGNYEAAENAGILVNRTIFINFILCSLAAAIGGVLLASRMNAATPGLGWPDKNLMIIATVVLGGTSLNGGYGSIIHTLGGVLTIGVIQNALNLLNVQSYYNTLLMGIILILVVFADSRFKIARQQAKKS